MKLPKKFKCAGFTINVQVTDIDNESNNYGNFSDVENLINIYRSVEVNGKVVQLTDEQIENTFYHELVHCFQFYHDNNITESEAQTFANFICEFLRTKSYE